MSILQKVALDLFSHPDPGISFWDLKYLYHHGLPEIPEPEPIFPLPEPQPDPSPIINFENSSFLPDSFFSYGDPSPQPSINCFDDVSQNVELIGDLSLINSFDVFG